MKKQAEQELLYLAFNNFVHTLIEISLPNKLQDILDDCENLGFEFAEKINGVNIELLYAKDIISDNILHMAEALKADFLEAYKEIPVKDSSFWNIQRKKAQKIIMFLWNDIKE